MVIPLTSSRIASRHLRTFIRFSFREGQELGSEFQADVKKSTSSLLSFGPRLFARTAWRIFVLLEVYSTARYAYGAFSAAVPTHPIHQFAYTRSDAWTQLGEALTCGAFEPSPSCRLLPVQSALWVRTMVVRRRLIAFIII